MSRDYQLYTQSFEWNKSFDIPLSHMSDMKYTEKPCSRNFTSRTCRTWREKLLISQIDRPNGLKNGFVSWKSALMLWLKRSPSPLDVSNDLATKPPPLRFRLVGVTPRKSEPSWLLLLTIASNPDVSWSWSFGLGLGKPDHSMYVPHWVFAPQFGGHKRIVFQSKTQPFPNTFKQADFGRDSYPTLAFCLINIRIFHPSNDNKISKRCRNTPSTCIILDFIPYIINTFPIFHSKKNWCLSLRIRIHFNPRWRTVAVMQRMKLLPSDDDKVLDHVVWCAWTVYLIYIFNTKKRP